MARPILPRGLRRLTRPLNLVLVILLTSAVMRVGAASQNAVLPITGVDGLPLAAADDCAPDPDIAALLESIKARQAQLSRDDDALRARAAAVRAAEDAVAQGLRDLESARADLDGLLAIASTAATQDVDQLVRVYENMKPADAARLFEAMTADFAAGFLSKMQPALAGSIMAALNPDFAYAISVVIAGRHVGLEGDG